MAKKWTFVYPNANEPKKSEHTTLFKLVEVNSFASILFWLISERFQQATYFFSSHKIDKRFSQV